MLIFLDPKFDFKIEQQKRTLTLRKEKINQKLMSLRLTKCRPLEMKFQVQENNEYYKEYLLLQSSSAKVNFLMNYMEKEINLDNLPLDPSIFYNSAYRTPMLTKYFLKELSSFTETLEEEDKNSEIKINIPEKIVSNLIKELYFTEDNQIKWIISSILMDLTFTSQLVTKLFIDNDYYLLQIIYKLKNRP